MDPTAARLLVTGADGDLLKARLEPRPSHPRALLTLLEGLSLWRGQALRVVLSVEDSCHRTLGSMLFGDGLWPAESQLVQFEAASPDHPQLRLRGLGDFRRLRARRTDA